LFGRDSKKKEKINDLKNVYDKIARKYNIPTSDFPNIDRTRDALNLLDFGKIKSSDKKRIKHLEYVINVETANLMELAKKDESLKTDDFEKQLNLVLNSFSNHCGEEQLQNV
jgi:hypothetical protein